MQNVIKPFDGLGSLFMTISYCDALRGCVGLCIGLLVDSFAF